MRQSQDLWGLNMKKTTHTKKNKKTNLGEVACTLCHVTAGRGREWAWPAREGCWRWEPELKKKSESERETFLPFSLYLSLSLSSEFTLLFTLPDGPLLQEQSGATLWSKKKKKWNERKTINMWHIWFVREGENSRREGLRLKKLEVNTRYSSPCSAERACEPLLRSNLH